MTETNGGSSEADTNLSLELSKGQVSKDLWEQRERVIRQKVRSGALGKLDYATEQLQAKIDNDGGYTREKEERQHQMSILLGANKFLENKTPNQSIDQWEAECLKNMAEMKKRGIIDEAEYDQCLEEISVAKGLLTESQQKEFAKLPPERMSRTELIQPEKPMEPQPLDAVELDSNGQSIASSKISKQIGELQQLIVDDEAPDKKAELRTKFNHMNMVKRVIESFNPEDGVPLKEWFAIKDKVISERVGICRQREDADGLKAQMLQREVLAEAKNRLSDAIAVSFEELGQEHAKARKVYARRLAAYYRGEYLTHRLGEDNAVVVGSRKPTPAEEAEMNHWSAIAAS